MLDEQVSNYDQEITFTTGFAGSGKSTLLAKQCTPTTLVMTPTHKAAEVLMGKGIENVYTIHSVLGLVPTVNQNFRKGQRLQKLNKIGETDLSSITHVVIDEFSMINTSILDLLLELLPSHTKVRIVGDPYQLPPVDGEAIDPEAYTDNIEELTTQHRAEAPEVVETFMRFMNYIKGTGEKDLKFNKNIKHGNLDDFNPATDRALAYTNAEVIRLNDIIAKNLGKTQDIAIGDEITINGIDAIFENKPGATIYPACISKGRLMEEDKLMLTAHKTELDIEKFGTDLTPFKQCSVIVEGETYNLYYDLHHYQTSKQLHKKVESSQHLVVAANKLDKDVHIPTWCKDNRGAKGVKERGQAWSRYLAHKNLVFDLRRPYATTIHKAQGQEFSTVYIAQDDIKKSIRNGYYVQYARLMYVALSRAVGKVVIV